MGWCWGPGGDGARGRIQSELSRRKRQGRHSVHERIASVEHRSMESTHKELRAVHKIWKVWNMRQGWQSRQGPDCAHPPCSAKECVFALWRDTEVPLKEFRQGSFICCLAHSCCTQIWASTVLSRGEMDLHLSVGATAKSHGRDGMNYTGRLWRIMSNDSIYLRGEAAGLDFFRLFTWAVVWKVDLRQVMLESERPVRTVRWDLVRIWVGQ